MVPARIEVMVISTVTKAPWVLQRVDETDVRVVLAQDDQTDRGRVVDVRQSARLVALGAHDDVHADVVLAALYARRDGLEGHLVELRRIAVGPGEAADEVDVEARLVAVAYEAEGFVAALHRD